MKRVHETQHELSEFNLEKERQLAHERIERERREKFEVEQQRYLDEMAQWHSEQKRLEEKLAQRDEERREDRSATEEDGEKKKKKDKGKGKESSSSGGLDFLKKINRGVQVDLVPLPSASTPPPPFASTSSNPSPLPTTTSEGEPLSPNQISEYRTLISSLHDNLASVEQDKVELDHRIAVLIQEKETLWPEQRQVLIEKAQAERREVEKKLEKALKRVQVLEKDRPPPVLRIGSESGPPLP